MTSITKWIPLVVLIAMFLVVACKQKEEDEETPDTTAPSIERINLADECTNVEKTSSLYLLFNEEMEDDTVTTNTTDTTCSGSLQVSNDDFSSCLQMLDNPQPDVEKKGFTLNLSGQLDPSNTYKVKVTTGVTDSAGNNMAGNFLTATGFETQADPGALYWTKQIGTSQDDYAKGIGLDSGGNIYLTGRTRSSFVDGSTNSGGWDIFLLKRDSALTNNSGWKKQLGTSADDYAEGLAIDSNDNIYIAGKTEGTLESGFSRSSDASGDAVLISYESDGTERWRKQLGGASDDWSFAVAVDKSNNINNIYVTGKTEGSLSGSNQGGSDIFLAKYNDSGTLQWVQQQGTTSDDAAYAIAIDSGDKIFITGHTEGQLASTASSGERDIFVMQWNTAGALQWVKQFGSDQDDYARGIATDSSGNVLVAGYSYGKFVSTNQGRSDIVLLKLDSSGGLVWQRQLASDKKDMGKAVVVDGNDDIFVGGLTEGSMNCKYNRGFSDVLLIRYNSDGTWQWTEQYGSVGLDYGKSLVLDGSNNLLFSGWTNGNIDGNFSEGNNDLLVLKYNQSGARQ